MLRRGDTFPGRRRLGLFSSESSRLLLLKRASTRLESVLVVWHVTRLYPLPGEPVRRNGLAERAPRRSARSVERRRGDDGLAMDGHAARGARAGYERGTGGKRELWLGCRGFGAEIKRRGIRRMKASRGTDEGVHKKQLEPFRFRECLIII